MDFKYFSRNGELLPVTDAVIPLSSIEYAYGFGVYESVRVSNGIVYFLADHIGRLMNSARIIGLLHPYTPEGVSDAVAQLLEKNGATTCNVKILLIGGKTAEDAQLNILCLNPLFPDKKLYRDGVACVTYEYERPFPHAKTLNMLQSYLAYRKAKQAGAYDALLIDRGGCITEGTRTNFFCIKGKTLFSPNEKNILPGVTRKAVLKVAADTGFEIVQKDIRPEDLPQYDGAFLTSTSAKILPTRSVDSYTFSEPPQALKELLAAFDAFLSGCGGKIEKASI
ncbi:aminotransferase class IV [Candidatus Kaiserbacteria bacterium]|nr:aminotransferase class IV [Candidatus Kaiserbacteria bacterium]